MKDELKSAAAVAMADKNESQAETCRAGKLGKDHFSARLIFLPSFRWATNCGAESKSVKLGKTIMLGQAGGQIVCKYLIMKDLQIIRRPGRSKSVKVNQTDCAGLISPRKIRPRRSQSQPVAVIVDKIARTVFPNDK
jgi:hypothetical protein